MSQDLFAAFGDTPSQHAVSLAKSSASIHTSLFDTWEPSLDSVQVKDEHPFEDDDFGEFEDASLSHHEVKSATTSASQVAPWKGSATPGRSMQSVSESVVTSKQQKTGSHPFAGHMDVLFAVDDDEYDAGQDDWGDLSANPEAAMAYSKKLIQDQQRQQEQDRRSTSSTKAASPIAGNLPAKKEPKKLRKKSGYVPPRDPDILFDAEDPVELEHDDDDFGDFETTDMARPPATAPYMQSADTEKTEMPAIDLLGLDDELSPTPPAKPSIGLSGSVPSRSATTGLLPATNDDEWDDFIESGRQSQISASAEASQTAISPSQSHQPRLAASSKPSSAPLPPPTTIPPPLILLSVFPRVFAEADSTLFGPLSNLSSTQRHSLLSHSATQQFLRKHLDQAHVLAHIVAGRKQRWKRDQILAQGMRIGPATAGGRGGGMKLAGVDRVETVKEDREVLDVLRLWRAQVGKLRSAVSGIKAIGVIGLPGVPEIAETMPVKALKANEGGFVAPHACALCGLKREERVAKVDLDVQDSFGEWWVDGSNMHVKCLKFWENMKGVLKSR